MESAQVTIVKGDLRGIVRAGIEPRHGNNIRQNLVLAFRYNAIGIPLAAHALYLFTGWLMSPLFAALAMSFVFSAVSGNALRLRSMKL
jgi:Cu+-exporting ATPase